MAEEKDVRKYNDRTGDGDSRGGPGYARSDARKGQGEAGVFGTPISAPTREQAIADGGRVDVTEAAKLAGFRVPMALTRAVWDRCMAVPEGAGTHVREDRLHDLLKKCFWLAALAGDTDVRFGTVLKHEASPSVVVLAIIQGRDGDGKPCLTVRLHDEHECPEDPPGHT